VEKSGSREDVERQVRKSERPKVRKKYNANPKDRKSERPKEIETLSWIQSTNNS